MSGILHFNLVLGAALAGAAAYRLRGSVLWSRWTGRGVGTARIMWATVCALVCAAGLPVWWLPIAVFVAHYTGSTLPQYSSIDAGHREGSAIGDVLKQSGRCLAAGVPVAAAYWLAGEVWLPPVLAAVAAGPLYALAWQINSPIEHLGKGGDSPELAEVFYGAAIGLSLALGVAL